MNDAFSRLDLNSDNVLEINDIKGAFNARTHPDVRRGTRSEDEVLAEFLQTFELHHHLRSTGSGVTREEFVEYYSHISASIDSDQYFESLIVNAYKARQQQKSFSIRSTDDFNQEYRSRTTQNAPFGTRNQATEYSSTSSSST